MKIPFTLRTIALSIASASLLIACGGGNSPPPTPATFQITLTNLTAGQPLSPLVAIAHSTGFNLFNIGQPVSVGLEHLAEGGETAPLVTFAKASSGYITSAVGGGPIPPGGSATVSLTVNQGTLATARLSLASMLVNTNDAITAVDAQSLLGVAVGSAIELDLLSYDAGTEANIETAATIPGPAGGGEGFNATRDDIRDAIHLHPGVLTNADGLSSSVLTAVHRWDNPVARVVITRVR